MKKLVLVSVFFIVANFIFAQKIIIPNDYKIENHSDYNSQKTKAVECINWIDKYTFDKYVDERKEAYKFIYTWTLQNPDYNKFYFVFQEIENDNHPLRAELMLAYATGQIIFAEKNPNATDFQLFSAGIDNLLMIADKNQHLNFNSKVVKKYQKLKSNNKLETYMKNQQQKAKNADSYQLFDFWFIK